mmetsp:Transcript_12360/g.25971  ORF Transcript_12360/g.25971 Transcript_12360/m.25971 type:complete len:84 (-) Transcript_12360:694-945(-)
MQEVVLSAWVMMWWGRRWTVSVIRRRAEVREGFGEVEGLVEAEGLGVEGLGAGGLAEDVGVADGEEGGEATVEVGAEGTAQEC